jgi:hypothetical protein
MEEMRQLLGHNLSIILNACHISFKSKSYRYFHFAGDPGKLLPGEFAGEWPPEVTAQAA